MADKKRPPQETRDMTVKGFIDWHRQMKRSDPSQKEVTEYEKKLIDRILPEVYEGKR